MLNDISCMFELMFLLSELIIKTFKRDGAMTSTLIFFSI